MRFTSWRVLVTGLVLVPLTLAGPVQSGPTGTVSGEITLMKDDSPKDNRSRVVVYLEGLSSNPAARKEVHQKDQTFSPELTVVVKGETVDFPNDDKIFHNVFSLSEIAKFDLGLYKSGVTKSVAFNQTGVVDVYCNIHPDMAAKVKVLDSGFFAVTGPDGQFKIDHVPPGKYPIVAWPMYGDEVRGEVDVAPGGTATVKLTVVERARPRSHVRKDGTPYGRYK
jgi:plastocyanin